MLTLFLLNDDERVKPVAYHVRGQGPEVIGRHAERLRIVDSKISRRHAEVSVQNGVWVVRDLGSANGTLVNGQGINGLCQLEEGDRLQLGRLTLMVGRADVNSSESASAPANGSMDASSRAAAVPNGVEAEAPAPWPLDDDAAASSVDLTPFSHADDSDAWEAMEASSADGGATPADSRDEPQAQGESASLDASRLLEASEEADQPSAESLLGRAFDAATEDDDVFSADDVAPIAFDQSTAAKPARPDSPLSTASRDVAADEPSADELSDEGDDAPPVYGLSLDMPKPLPSSTADAAAHPSPDDSLESALDLSGLDVEGLDDAIDPEDLSEPDTATSEADVSAVASRPADTRIASASREDSPQNTPRTGETVALRDVVMDDEAEDEPYTLAPESSSGRWKMVAVVLLMLGLTGGGLWAWQAGHLDTMIAGLSSKPTSVATGNGTPAGGDVDANGPPAPTPATGNNTDTPTGTAADGTRPSAADPFGPGVALSTPQPSNPAPTTQGRPTVTPPQPAPAVLPIDPTTITPPAPSETAAVTPPTPVEVPGTTAVPPAVPGDASAANTPGSTPKDDVAMSTPPPPATGEAVPSPAVETIPPVVTPGEPRRIAYLIDASGSMVDSMSQGALSWLADHLATLRPEDRFTVLFFRNDGLTEPPPAGLKSADPQVIAEVNAWVAPSAGNVRMQGKSEPMAAVRQAQAYNADEVYILADNKFGDRGANRAGVGITDLERLLASKPMTVHTVQFFYDDPTDRRLQRIAERFEGTYEFVPEPDLEALPGGMDLFGSSR